MGEDVVDLHEREHGAFLEEVHSFQHWFDAVEGYLHDLDHGHRRDLSPTELSGVERERLVAILANYSVAETAALEASSGLVRIAPNHAAKIFLSTQVVDEGRHVEVVHHRMRELGVVDPVAEVEVRASRAILDLKGRLLELVDAHDWEGAIFAQNVILEAMEFTVFEAHSERADPITRDALQRMVRDERRHMGFGENELGRRLRQNPRLRARIAGLKQGLDAMALRVFEESMGQIGLAASERPQLGRGYLRAVERLGLE
jgi:1,2-phenylacetyl-CoA epoxidase catalytic subunit